MDTSPEDDTPGNAPAGRWEFDEAQRRLEEVADRALDEGPQVISRDGQECVVLAEVEYLRLVKENMRSKGLDPDRDMGLPRDARP